MTTTATADPSVTRRRSGARLLAAATRRVDGASAAVLRVALGAIVATAMLRYLATGWVTTQLTGPAFHVTYPGFEWVRPLPGGWMHGVVVVVAIAGGALALGWRTRMSAAVALVGFAWIELVDAATYLNHYELITLLLAWAAVLPVGATWSLDARRIGPAGSATRTIPAGVVWILRAQLGSVYVFAGLAKLGTDWLVHGEPLTHWFASRTDLPIIGPLLGLPGAGLAASWAGAGFDLTVVALLLTRRTRAFAYAAVVAFHLVTWYLFPRIGIFPLAMLLLTPIFFAPSWPRRFVRTRQATLPTPQPVAAGHPSRGVSPLVVAAVATVAVIQLALPLRHWVLGRDVAWDDIHSRWSWRVLVNDRAGVASLDVVDPRTDRHRTVLPEQFLAPHQASYVSSRPEALRQLAVFVADDVERTTSSRPRVFVTAWVSINGSRRHEIVDPTVDLAAAGPSWSVPAWVIDRTG